MNAFPNARSELREAGNAFAIGCSTATVFHLMRAVEWGMRAFAAHFGIIRLLKSKKKPNKPKKYVPIAWAEWGQIIESIHVKVDEKIVAMAAGEKKQAAQEFYYPLLRDLRGFKEAFRNHVSHNRRSYNSAKAQDNFDHVRRFMTLLATKVSLPLQRFNDDGE